MVDFLLLVSGKRALGEGSLWSAAIGLQNRLGRVASSEHRFLYPQARLERAALSS